MSEPCLVCASEDHKELYPSTFQDSIDHASDYFLAHRKATARGRIVRCANYGFVFTSPRFTPDAYTRIYRQVVAPTSDSSAFDEADSARFRRLAATVKRYVPDGSDFIDFGCGSGGFLRAFGSLRARGFEVGEGEASHSDGMEIVRGDWSSFAGSQQCPPSSLDFVTAFDVFEHLPLLSRDVALIHGILKEGGLLFASVPNVESLIAKVLGGRWNMMLLEHLWYFSPDTARRFLEPLGFKEVRTLGMPYDAPIRHILTRAAQVFGREGEISIPLISNLVLPVPAGVMLLIYRKV